MPEAASANINRIRSSKASSISNGARSLQPAAMTPPQPARSMPNVMAAPTGADSKQIFQEYQTEVNRLKDENT